jgi:hypothetical protein
MLPRLAYREFHEQTNTAATVLVLMAEFGLEQPNLDQPRQELLLHGLIQRGAYQEGRGLLLGNALGRLSDAGLLWTVLHDPARTAALENRVRSWVPDYHFELLQDLGAAAQPWGTLDSVFRDNARVLLIESRHSIRGLRAHLLLARRARRLHVMNSFTGRNHAYDAGAFAAHLASPVSAGAVAFAGSQYLYTGLAVRVWSRAAGARKIF